MDLLDRAIQGKHGGDHSKIDIVNLAPVPDGTSEAYALRRLRKDRPDLHAQVLAGELSAHRAAVQAGFRPATVTVRVDDPQRAVATVRRYFTRDQIDAALDATEQR